MGIAQYVKMRQISHKKETKEYELVITLQLSSSVHSVIWLRTFTLNSFTWKLCRIWVSLNHRRDDISQLSITDRWEWASEHSSHDNIDMIWHERWVCYERNTARFCFKSVTHGLPTGVANRREREGGGRKIEKKRDLRMNERDERDNNKWVCRMRQALEFSDQTVWSQ